MNKRIQTLYLRFCAWLCGHFVHPPYFAIDALCEQAYRNGMRAAYKDIRNGECTHLSCTELLKVVPHPKFYPTIPKLYYVDHHTTQAWDDDYYRAIIFWGLGLHPITDASDIELAFDGLVLAIEHGELKPDPRTHATQQGAIRLHLQQRQTALAIAYRVYSEHVQQILNTPPPPLPRSTQEFKAAPPNLPKGA